MDETKKRMNLGHNYRAFQRFVHEASIFYSRFPDQEGFRGRMANYCTGGMQFEAENPVYVGTDICIRIEDEIPAFVRMGIADGCRAQVMWCGELKEVFTAGVRFMPNICNLCGQIIPYRQIQKTDNFVRLCASCSNYLATLPEGRLKQSIENYLLGNVV